MTLLPPMPYLIFIKIVFTNIPKILAESSQHIFMCFEGDTSDHQHTITEKTLYPLIVELLKEVATVISKSIHARTCLCYLKEKKKTVFRMQL